MRLLRRGTGGRKVSDWCCPNCFGDTRSGHAPACVVEEQQLASGLAKRVAQLKEEIANIQEKHARASAKIRNESERWSKHRTRQAKEIKTLAKALRDAKARVRFEREACAALVDDGPVGDLGWSSVADAIRARGGN